MSLVEMFEIKPQIPTRHDVGDDRRCNFYTQQNIQGRAKNSQALPECDGL